MNARSHQPGLFDTEPDPGRARAAVARARMREMIHQLRSATEPPWSNQMGIILWDAEFKRAMWSVPDDEGAALWAEFDAQMERLDAIWLLGQPAPQG